MAGTTRESMKSEIVRRRVREMYPQGFTVQDIAGVCRKTDRHIRQIIAQEFPQGCEQGDPIEFVLRIDP
jgi:hypothetical protein